MAEEKMQFINTSTNFSDLEGEIGGATSQGTTNTNTSKENKPSTSIIHLGTQSQYISTLDEPVSVTISRDLKAVAYKFGHVFFPKKSNALLRDWDLWGPLSLCVLLSILLQGKNTSENSNAPEFASIFALIAFGAIVVTVNTKLLSGKLSFFQSICVLGYCLLPLVLVSLLKHIIVLVIGSQPLFLSTICFVMVFISFGWSVFASTAFLTVETINLQDKKALAIYPIFLFYFIISWLIILDN
jgi:hypothetical protein